MDKADLLMPVWWVLSLIFVLLVLGAWGVGIFANNSRLVLSFGMVS